METSMPHMVADREGDWQCPNTSCVNHNNMVFGKNASCPKCGTAKNATKAGDWACPNTQCVNHKNTVFARRSTCPKCGSSKPASFGMQGSSQMQQQMQMQMQMQMQQMMQMQMMQMQNKVGGNNTGDWSCPNASCINNSKMVFGTKSSCPKCGASKPMPMPMMMSMPMDKRRGGGQGGSNPGDWKCPNLECRNHRNHVFAKHDECPECGMERPRHGGGFHRSRSPRRQRSGRVGMAGSSGRRF